MRRSGKAHDPTPYARSSVPETEFHRLRILYELLYNLTTAQTLEDVYESATSALISGTEAGRTSIRIFDDDGVMRFKAWRGLSSEYREALTGHAPWSKGTLDALPILKPDLRRDKDLAPLHDVFAREGISAVGFIPLVSKEGVFGTFNLYYRQPHGFSDNEVLLAQAIAYHIAAATEKRKAECQLADVARRRKAILNSTGVIIVVKDPEGRYTLANRSFRRVFHTSQQVVGKTDYDLFSKEVADRLRANDSRVLNEGRAIECEEEVPHDDGVHTYISEKIPLRSSEETIVAVCTIAKDITDRKKAETELRRSNRNLEQFAYSVSHDLKEPIRMVVAFTELLRKCYAPSLDAQANEYMQFVVEGALRMETLVSGLFAFLQSTDISDEQIEPVDCDSAVSQAKELLPRAIEKSCADITIGPMPLVEVRRMHLIQLFQNLIDNAIKYAKVGVPPRISIRAERESRMWRFSVSDNGIGIAPEHSEQVFGLFKRLHPHNEYSGTGIGLAICHNIVDWYGGRIWVESEVGHGSTFYFTLPGPEKRPACAAAS
jgi:PAS domain S-box-containing protein